MKKTILATLVTSSIFCHAIPANATAISTNEPVKKPNVVVLYLDDAGFSDISANGGKVTTPKLDEFSRAGINLQSFYTSSSVSSPSRAGLFTGRLGNRTGMWGKHMHVLLDFDKDGLPQSETTLADILDDNGYDTALLGKWHLGVGDHNQFTPTRHGFDEWYGIPGSNDMFYNKFDNQKNIGALHCGTPEERKAALKERASKKADLIGNDGRGNQSAFDVPVYHSYKNNGKFDDNITGIMNQSEFTQDITNRAVHYIEEHKDNPFFLFVSYPQTHVPLFTSPKFKGVTDTAYGDVMKEIDDSAGRILSELHQQGLDEDTIVIFTSDNGPWLGYQKYGASGSALPYRDGKATTYEGGVRVPAIIRWSGHIKPGHSNEMFSALDFLPTLTKLTHSTLPNVDLDGFDMSLMLLQGKASPRQEMPYYYMGDLQAFRMGKWKIHFMTSSHMVKKKLDKPELYNLDEDISEKNNVADKYPEIVAKLAAQANKYDKSIGGWETPLFDLDDQYKGSNCK
ncbi:Arylsulfatase precursor [Vibrio ruber DSM 16370]|uniref:Arylsulfatase n=1 Tax=Vibrio ruber (strain DSM 16370 / JCM 11486 / BCRC 17186 / CECT 7878 / LMG 23124 / VR1) TaxID=1123498 RepID=A0A1R4LAC5_VIBR1|nr:sulfatase-like hydrolase/transferase [Vibrio ruber]SJN53496.1 Arylsulfatase precursor [Vibrio ruber DSM 16370]